MIVKTGIMPTVIDTGMITRTITSGGKQVRRTLCAVGTIVAMVFPVFVHPCTTFCFSENREWIFGRNYDWSIEDCLIVVNKRSVLKTAFTRDNPATWISRYGSITFNQYGREFPLGGMNQAGLVIECMWLEGTEYPHADERYALSELQWVQYQLDMHETVEQIIQSDTEVRITRQNSVPLHFLACDRTGQSAVIEFLGGKMAAYTRDDLPASALTNNTYRNSLEFLRAFRGKEKEAYFDIADYSLKRFVWAAHGITSWNSDADTSAVDYAFKILEKTAVDFTMFRIVYDVGNNLIYFTNKSNPHVRFLRIDAFDFSCSEPAKILDITSGERGDVTSFFVDYTYAANYDLITRSYAGTDFLKTVPEETRRTVAAYPETMKCQGE